MAQPDDDEGDIQPLPCNDPRPTYESLDFLRVFVCEGCGYYIELSPRGPLWQHHVPLILLRPPTAEALLKVLERAWPEKIPQRRQRDQRRWRIPRQWRPPTWWPW